MKTHSTISVDIELVERINRFSKQNDIPKSLIYSKAVQIWLDEHEDKINNQNARGKGK